MAWIAQAAIAAYGAYSANKNAKNANKAAKQGSSGTSTTTNEPWEPTKDARLTGLDDALSLYQNDTRQFNPYRPKGGGPSKQTQKIGQQIIDRGVAGSPLAQKANDTASSMLDNGSPELQELYQRGASSNPYLKQFIESRMGNDSPSTGGGVSGPSYRVNYDGSRIQSPTSAGSQAESYIKKILDGQYLNEGNPYSQQLVDNINSQVRKNYTEEDIPGINSSANMHGRLGSGAWENLQLKANDQFEKNLNQNATGVLQSDWNFERSNQMQALQQLLGLDMARMSDATNRASINASSNAAAASQASADKAREEQMLLSAIGQYSGDQQFGDTYLGNLATQLAGNRQDVLSKVPELSGLDMRDLGTAFGVSGQMDAARGAASERQRQYDIQKWNFEQDKPYSNLNNLSRYVDMFGGGFGTQTSTGTNTQPWSPINTTNATIAGGLQGAQAFSDVYNMYQNWQKQRQQSQTDELARTHF